jgi:hypothetical protein
MSRPPHTAEADLAAAPVHDAGIYELCRETSHGRVGNASKKSSCDIQGGTTWNGINNRRQAHERKGSFMKATTKTATVKSKTVTHIDTASQNLRRTDSEQECKTTDSECERFIAEHKNLTQMEDCENGRFVDGVDSVSGEGKDDDYAATESLADVARTRAAWKGLGYRVPTKAIPATVEKYLVPGYRNVYRDRHLFSFSQVMPTDAEESLRRSIAAEKAVSTKIKNMNEAMRDVELTITHDLSNEEIYELAIATHGGNYLGDPGPFNWSNRKARNTIRHCLTNYEKQWKKINRGRTAETAYNVLRDRVDALIDEKYPQFAEGMPQVVPWRRV